MSIRQHKDDNEWTVAGRQGAESQRPQAASLLEHQRAIIRMATQDGMSNLVDIALQANSSANVTQISAARGPNDVPLVTACLKGHLDVVKNLIEKCHASLDCRADVTLDNQDIKGAIPLWAASYSGNLDLVKYLVLKGANVNACTGTQSSPLRVAAFDGHAAIVKFLLEKGADVNSVNNSGNSVLMAACYKNRPDVVKILLDHAGVNVNYTTPDTARAFAGHTALHFCAISGNTDILKMLLAHGATINYGYHGTTALLLAACEGQDDFVDYVVGIPDVSRDQKADALELLGTTHWKSQHIDKCLALWQRAMEERHRPGRPVAQKREAEKLVVYGNATECQTMAEVKRLQSSRDINALGVQCMLIRERILGKEHEETCYIIRYNAALFADTKKYDRAVELVFQVLDNLALLRPIHKEMLTACRLLTAVLYGAGGESHGVTCSHTLKSLKRVLSELQRGESQLEQLQSDSAILINRHNLLKIALHLICLLFRTVKQASSEERNDFLTTVVSLVQSGIHGPKGGTLLHMACDKETTDFDEGRGKYEGGQFPAPEVVNVLLEAGCDVAAENEAGQTALQVAQEQDGNQEKLINALLSDGVASMKFK